MASDPLLAFKAGRYQRRPETRTLDPIATKGAIVMYNEDGLLHFQWKNRETGEVPDDLIVFAQDASFTKVVEAPEGRTYMLRFSSSNERHFFWFQDASSARDEEFANNVSALLENPEAVLSWNFIATTSNTNADLMDTD